MTTRSDIIDILKTIKYPGFSRDIVSFGIIKEIELNENNLNLVISIKSTNSKVADELEKLIINKLRLRKPKISTKISQFSQNFEFRAVLKCANLVYIEKC